MNSKELENLIKISALKTSNDFSNQVLERIEARESIAKSFKSKINTLFILISITILLAFFVEIPTLTYSQFSITIPPIILSVIISIFLLIEIRKIHQFRELILKA